MLGDRENEIMRRSEGFFGERIAILAVLIAIATAVACRGRADGTDAGDSASIAQVKAADNVGKLLKGEGAYGDWREDAPGVRRLITPR